MKGNSYNKNNETGHSKNDTRQKPEKRKSVKNITQIMNGEFLTKKFVVSNLNYIFFVIFLLVLVVTKGYYVRQLANDITKQEKKLQDITADYVETKQNLKEKTERKHLIKKLAPLGLTETLNPTKVIRITEENKEEE